MTVKLFNGFSVRGCL